MKTKFLTKSKIAIAAISTLILAGCSSVELYPDQKRKNTEALSSSNFRQVEVQMIEVATNESEVAVFNLTDDKLTEQKVSTTLGNKKIDLTIAIEDCVLCDSGKLMARASVKSENVIKVTEVANSNILPNELAALEPMSAQVKIALSDSLDPGEEVLVDETQPKNPIKAEIITEKATEPKPVASIKTPTVTAEAATVVTPELKPLSVAQFTPPQGVKPFIYNSDKVNNEDIFQPHITQYAKKTITYNNGEYQELISNDALKTTSTLVNYDSPIIVKFKLIK